MRVTIKYPKIFGGNVVELNFELNMEADSISTLESILRASIVEVGRNGLFLRILKLGHYRWEIL